VVLQPAFNSVRRQQPRCTHSSSSSRSSSSMPAFQCKSSKSAQLRTWNALAEANGPAKAAARPAAAELPAGPRPRAPSAALSVPLPAGSDPKCFALPCACFPMSNCTELCLLSTAALSSHVLAFY